MPVGSTDGLKVEPVGYIAPPAAGVVAAGAEGGATPGTRPTGAVGVVPGAGVSVVKCTAGTVRELEPYVMVVTG